MLEVLFYFYYIRGVFRPLLKNDGKKMEEEKYLTLCICAGRRSHDLELFIYYSGLLLFCIIISG